MHYIQNLLRAIIIVILALFAFGPPTQTQAAPSYVEPTQFSCANVTEIPLTECEALVALYNETDGPNWDNTAGWLVTNTPCSWYGVTCDSGYITKLVLLAKNLQGNVPSEIGNLTNLTELNLWNNELRSLPTEISNLTNLTKLNLFSSQLSRLPSEIGSLTNLTELTLSHNDLSSVPTEIWNLTNLTTLDLSGNHLSSLPAEIGNLTNLTTLALMDNQLSSLPAEIGNLTNLTGLLLNSNNLNSLPVEIGDLTNLIWLSLYSNDLSSLPAEIGNLTNLTMLYLMNNQLSSLPASFINLTELGATNWEYLDVGRNHLVDLSAELQTFLDEKAPGWLDSQTDPQNKYEPDNICTNATTIQPNGPSQSHTLHSPTDTDWTTFTAPTPGIYRIEVTIPDNSRADVDLYYYTDCDGFHEESFTETFAPGARLDVEAEQAGQQFYIRVKNFDALQFGPDVTYNLSVREMPSQRADDGDPLIPGPAIVVAGRYRGTDSVQDNIDQTALAAYDFFVAKGRTDSEIFFLTTNSALPNVDGDATERNLAYGIITWAKEQLEKENVAQVLTLYLVDHGGPDEFYLDRLNQEILTPNDLDGWLSTLEAEFPDLLVNVIIEACRAGSFIARENGSISKPGRVIITSSSASYDAYVSRYGAHFSDNFLTFLLQEHNLGYSFQESSNMVQRFHSRQEPWIDADGDGEHNELNDLSLASLRGFAQAGTLGDDWPPYIVSANISSQGTAMQTEVRHKGNNAEIEAVWAVVYPPSYTPPTGEDASEDDGELNIENLDIIEFQADGEASYVESEAYSGFTESGVYRVVVHARDVHGLVAQPVTVEVDTRHWVYLPMISR